MEKRRENDVKIIQADFDNMKARQEYERRVMLGLVLVVVLSLFGVIVVLYLRYKTFRNKAAIARDQVLIKNYELRLAELQQQGKDKSQGKKQGTEPGKSFQTDHPFLSARRGAGVFRARAQGLCSLIIPPFGNNLCRRRANML